MDITSALQKIMYEIGPHYVMLVSSVPWQNRLDSLLTQDRISD